MKAILQVLPFDNKPFSFFVRAALVVLLLSSAGCGKQAAKAPPAPQVVDVITVLQKDVQTQREWVGTLDGDVNATIRPQVTGYLIKQNYREGDSVKKGQILFEIDPRTFEATVAQAKALQSQQQAIHQKAAATLARVKPLAEKNALSQKDLDDAIGNELSARAALDQASAALDTAQLNLGFTRIVSPINGIAGIAKAQIGDLLSPTAQGELTTVSTVNPIKVYVSISEREYLASVKEKTPGKYEDRPLQLVLVDGSIHPHPGRISLLDRQVDATTGTVKVGALFPNPGGRLRPGQFAKIRAQTAVLKDALLVPQRAVTEIQGKYLIAVVGEGNKIEMRQVMPGERLGSDWVISEGLKPGEKVVVEGTQKVRAGSVVSPKLVAPGPSAPTAGGKPGSTPEKQETPAKNQQTQPTSKG